MTDLEGADLRSILDELLDADSDLVGRLELDRLALARELLDISPADQVRPAISAFLAQVARDARQRTAPLDDTCPAGAGGHVWRAFEGGYERTWKGFEVVVDDRFDGVTARVLGPAAASEAGEGPVLLRCSRPSCEAERYVPFEWDVEWSL